jgi:hypothetical protein
MDKTICFAYSNDKCSALNIRRCQGTPCAFYKTRKQKDIDDAWTKERLIELKMYPYSPKG